MLKGRPAIIGRNSFDCMETIVNNFGLPPAQMLVNLRTKKECNDKRIEEEWEAYLRVTDDGEVDSWFLEEKATVLDHVPEPLQPLLRQMFQYTNRPSAQQCIQLFIDLQ